MPLVVLAASLVTGSVIAARSGVATITWIAPAGVTGNWDDGANWNGNVEPTVGDGAVINTGGTAEVTTAANAADAVRVNQARLRITGAGRLQVETAQTGENSNGFIDITAGGQMTIAGATPETAIGFSGGNGNLLIDGAGSSFTSADPASEILVGFGAGSTGSITLSNGGTLTSTPTIVLGVNTGAGTLTIGGVGINPGTLAANVTSGPLAGSAAFVIHATTALTYGGNISGSVALTKEGNSSLTLTGTNTHTGGTTVNAGSLIVDADSIGGNVVTNNTLTFAESGSGTYAGSISGTGGVSINQTGTITFTGTHSYNSSTQIVSGTLRAGVANTLPAAELLTINSPGTFNLNNFNQNVATLSGSGSVQLGSATLTTGSANSDSTFSGVLTGSTLTKAGSGTLTLSGANTHTETVVQNGRVNFNGNQPASDVMLQGGVAGGTGTIDSFASPGGTLHPGLSPGLLVMADMTLSSGTTFFVEIDGVTAGTQYDQARVTTGAVDLSDAALSGSLGFAPAAGTVFTIIDKQSAGAVTGTFNGIAQGGLVTIGGAQFAVSYTGGNGNDVTLTATGTPLVAPATLPAMTVGEPFNATITASGGVAPYTFTVTAGSLPAGLALNAGTGVISGTPTTAGPYSFTVTATDNFGFTDSQAYSGDVLAAVPSMPAIGLALLALLLAGIGYTRLRAGGL